MRDAVVHTRLMSLISKERGREGARQALQVFDALQRDGLRPDLIAFNTAIAAAGVLFASRPTP